jgi:hypothetical protein
MDKLPKKIEKHLTPVEALQEEGKHYVEVVQDLYQSPEVQNYLPLAPDLVGEAPSVSDTSGVVVAPRQGATGGTEPGQEQPVGASGSDRANQGAEAAVGAYRGQSEGPPEMTVYVPLTNPKTVGTAGKRMVPVKAPDQSDVYEFGRFIAGAYRAYMQEGRLYPETIQRYSGISIEKIGYYLRQEETTHALAIRGVSTEVHLTPEQDYVISILGDTSSKLNWNERMRRAGVSNAKLMAWRKNPVFDNAMKGLAEQVTANHDVALFELGRKVGEGDMRAIEKSLEISGRYNPAQQSTVDAIAIINKTVEVLAKHLSDQPDLLKAIAKDLSHVQQDVRQIESKNNQSIFGLG